MHHNFSSVLCRTCLSERKRKKTGFTIIHHISIVYGMDIEVSYSRQTAYSNSKKIISIPRSFNIPKINHCYKRLYVGWPRVLGASERMYLFLNTPLFIRPQIIQMELKTRAYFRFPLRPSSGLCVQTRPFSLDRYSKIMAVCNYLQLLFTIV